MMKQHHTGLVILALLTLFSCNEDFVPHEQPMPPTANSVGSSSNKANKEFMQDCLDSLLKKNIDASVFSTPSKEDEKNYIYTKMPHEMKIKCDSAYLMFVRECAKHLYIDNKKKELKVFPFEKTVTVYKESPKVLTLDDSLKIYKEILAKNKPKKEPKKDKNKKTEKDKTVKKPVLKFT